MTWDFFRVARLAHASTCPGSSLRGPQIYGSFCMTCHVTPKFIHCGGCWTFSRPWKYGNVSQYIVYDFKWAFPIVCYTSLIQHLGLPHAWPMHPLVLVSWKFAVWTSKSTVLYLTCRVTPNLIHYGGYWTFDRPWLCGKSLSVWHLAFPYGPSSSSTCTTSHNIYPMLGPPT